MNAAREGRVFFAAIFLPLLLNACVSMQPSGESGAALAQAGWEALKMHPECCYDYAQLSRLPLPSVDTPSVYSIDQTRQSFRFDEEKSLVLMFELPRFTQAYAIQLNSLPVGDRLDAEIWVPRVMLFDASFHLTREWSENSLRHRHEQLERTVFINPDNAQERYLLIYGAPRTPPVVHDIPRVSLNHTIFGPLPFTFAQGADVPATLSPAPVGQLQVSVVPSAAP